MIESIKIMSSRIKRNKSHEISSVEQRNYQEMRIRFRRRRHSSLQSSPYYFFFPDRADFEIDSCAYRPRAVANFPRAPKKILLFRIQHLNLVAVIIVHIHYESRETDRVRGKIQRFCIRNRYYLNVDDILIRYVYRLDDAVSLERDVESVAYAKFFAVLDVFESF